MRARQIQADRYLKLGATGVYNNAATSAKVIEQVAQPDSESKQLLVQAAEKFNLSARAYHRVLKVARTLADLGGAQHIKKPHIAEALGYRIGFGT